jgi:GT2 family glycosyltransferase
MRAHGEGALTGGLGGLLPGGTAADPATLSVVIPTYRRPDDVRRCLEGVHRLARQPDEVLVIVHHLDIATQRLLAELAADWPALATVTVEAASVVAAMHAGVRRVSGSIVAFLDDDTVPAENWAQRLLEHYAASESLGGVGGKDNIVGASAVPCAKVVGTIAWWGQIRGNHERGCGAAREVDILKGANMSFRRDALRGIEWPFGLRGGGAEPHHEVHICIAVRRLGYRIVYDPAIEVEHHVSPRANGLDRLLGNAGNAEIWNYNLGYALRRLELRRLAPCVLIHITKLALAAVWHAMRHDEPNKATNSVRGISAFCSGVAERNT